MSVNIDSVGRWIEWGAVSGIVGGTAHWTDKRPWLVRKLFPFKIGFAEINERARLLMSNNKELADLSHPQLIVLYGKLWEKEIKKEHLKEVEDLLKK